MKYFLLIVLLIVLLISMTAARASQLDGLDQVGLSYGVGDMKLYVFVSPTCPYCRVFDIKVRDQLTDLGFKVTYLVVASKYDKANRKIADAFYCSDDKIKVLNGFQSHVLGFDDSPVDPTCAQTVDDINHLASFYQIKGTPSIVLPDDTVLAGVPDVDQLFIKYVKALGD